MMCVCACVCVCVCVCTRTRSVMKSGQLFATPWTSPPGFSLWDFPGKNIGGGLLFSPPKDFLNPGIQPTSPVSHALTMDSLPLSHQTMIGHVKRPQGSALSGSSWPNQETLKHQNNDSKGL